uniref:CW domain-containing protein n=1 Tax=Angiostrongylus cantonensis TaxID=6313 RepID=A0A0K0D648_ANGCA
LDSSGCKTYCRKTTDQWTEWSEFFTKSLEERCDARQVPRASRTHWATLKHDREKWRIYWRPLESLDDKRDYYYVFQDYWTKVGYNNNPVNMLGLRKDQFVKIMSDPSLHWNRSPNLPVSILPRNYAQLSCKPPMCNPYTQSFGFGVSCTMHSTSLSIVGSD